jgi:tetratricopeptide (TPR) repeat protein
VTRPWAAIALVALAGSARAEAAGLTAATVERAGRLATEAAAGCAGGDASAAARARQALDLTTEFEPTAFVKTGRKGEVVEDLYVEARKAYRSHRALLYQAMGECLAAEGATAAAARHLRRAVVLDNAPERRIALARVRLKENAPAAALDLLLPLAGPASMALLEQAADAAGLASVQVEIDRVRFKAIEKVAPVDGPVRLPTGARLSSGGPLRFEAEPVVFYVPPSACLSCSADLQALKREAVGARVVLWPEDPERDHAFRQVAQLYKYDWPFLVGVRPSMIPGLTLPALVVVGREGWSAARLPADRIAALPEVLAVVARRDLDEPRPRKAWNGRPADRGYVAPAAPAFLDEGLAPAEEGAASAAFTAGLAAFRAGRFQEALRSFDAAAAEGALLPPEARLDRAVCIARMGRKDEARRILLRIGDSRFQDDIDRIMEGLNVRGE